MEQRVVTSIVETPAVLFGYHETAWSVPEKLRSAWEPVLQSLRRLPLSQREACEQALQQAPSLLHSESDPLRYLGCENGNAIKAAQRLALHWTIRKRLFGDRFLLPLDATAKGAVNEQYLKILKKGLMTWLPGDAKGRQVLWWDKSVGSLNDGLDAFTEESQSRALFTMLVHAKAKPLMIVSFYDSLETESIHMGDMVRGMPLQVGPWVCLYQASPGSKRLFQEAIDRDGGFSGTVGNDHVVTVVSESVDELCQNLQERGLGPDAIPERLGGNLQTSIHRVVDHHHGLEDQEAKDQDRKRPADRELDGWTINEPLKKSVHDKITASTDSQDDGLRQLVWSAVQRLPHQDRAALDEAQQRVPKIVLEESDPVAFLHARDDVPDEAADSLAKYWKHRCEIFGDRAFLPMYLNREGTLTEEEIEVLKTGYLAFLPENLQGKTVLYIDNDKDESPLLEGPLSSLRKTRCLFYMLQVAAQSKAPVVIVRVWKSWKWETARAQNVTDLIQFMPLTLERFLDLFSLPTGDHRMFTNTIEPFYHQFVKEIGLHHKCSPFVAQTPTEFLPVLHKFGCTEKGLPKDAGGTWMYEDFKEWLEGRLGLEAGARPAPQGSDETMVVSLGSLKDPPAPSSTVANQTLSNLVAAADLKLMQERKDRKRNMDLMYARKRRQREKDEEDGLQGQFQALSKENLRLHQERQLLEQLVADAKLIVQTGTPSYSSMVAHATVPPVSIPHAASLEATLPLLGSSVNSGGNESGWQSQRVSDTQTFAVLQQQRPGEGQAAAPMPSVPQLAQGATGLDAAVRRLIEAKKQEMGNVKNLLESQDLPLTRAVLGSVDASVAKELIADLLADPNLKGSALPMAAPSVAMISQSPPLHDLLQALATNLSGFGQQSTTTLPPSPMPSHTLGPSHHESTLLLQLLSRGASHVAPQPPPHTSHPQQLLGDLVATLQQPSAVAQSLQQQLQQHRTESASEHLLHVVLQALSRGGNP